MKEFLVNELLEKSQPSTCIIDYDVQQQQVIINDMITVQEIKIPKVMCPTCNRVLATIDNRLTFGDLIIKIYEELRPRIKYCPECGQKLAYLDPNNK